MSHTCVENVNKWKKKINVIDSNYEYCKFPYAYENTVLYKPLFIPKKKRNKIYESVRSIMLHYEVIYTCHLPSRHILIYS